MDKVLEVQKDDGTMLFRTIHYEMVCDPCKEQGEEIACQHKLGELPPWLSKKNYMDLQKVMEDHAEAYLAELMGVQKDPNIVPAFDNETITALSIRTPYVGLRSKIIRVGVDPGSSATADYAITSTLQTDDGDIVVSYFFFKFFL